MEPYFLEKISFWGCAKTPPKQGLFGFCKKNSSLMCRFFGFKSCTIITFMILLKPHIWEKSGFHIKFKNALGKSDCSIFKLRYLKIYQRYKVDFLYAGIYLLKLQIDDVILHEWGQACPGMLKEAIKTLRSQKLMKVRS